VLFLSGIRRFTTKSRLSYMKKYLLEKSTGPSIWTQLLGMTYRCLPTSELFMSRRILFTADLLNTQFGCSLSHLHQ